MDNTTEPIRQDIDQIRASMTDKMEQIEAKIKGTVNETTDSVKRMVDVKHQIGEHPWPALGAAVVAGFVLGAIGGGDSDPAPPGQRRYGLQSMGASDAYERARASAYGPEHGSFGSGLDQGAYGTNPSAFSSSGYGQGFGTPGYSHSASFGGQGFGAGHSQASYTGGAAGYGQSYGQSAYSPERGQGFGGHSQASYTGYGHGYSQDYGQGRQGFGQAGSGLMDSITRQFGGEIETLKSAAVASVISALRDTIRRNLPAMHQELERMRGSAGATSPAYTPASSTASQASAPGSYETKSGYPEETRH